MLNITGLFSKAGNFKLSDISLDVCEGEYFILLGPTGAGKTTLLKSILGLIPAQKGKINLMDKDITDLPTEKRNIGFLPQSYLLFPNMNVRENIFYGLSVKRGGSEKEKASAMEIINLLGLNPILDRNIRNLSGGEAQKVALARALCVNPSLVLLDEPFSAIDQGMKQLLWFEIKQILKRLKTTVIHITHNLDEAYALGEKIAVVIDGRIEQAGTREEIFLRPKNERIARYLGITNIFDATVKEIRENKITAEIKTGAGLITLPIQASTSEKDKIKICVRPEDIKILKENQPVKEELKNNVFDGEVLSANFFPDTCIIKIKSFVELEAKFPAYIYKRCNLSVGGRLKFSFWEPSIIVFKE